MHEIIWRKLKAVRLVIVISLTLFLIISLSLYFNKLSESKSNISNNSGAYKFCDKFQKIGSKQQCWENLIENTLKSKGLDSAFNLVDYLYSNEPQFASDCHGYTHLLGEKAYQLFSQNKYFKLSSKASYCGYGFYHAFMQTLLHTTNSLNQARDFCDYVGRQTGQGELLRLSCFHGIGHGLLEDIPNPVLNGDAQAIIKKPLEICTEVSKTDIEEYRCASGVFNVLAIYYQNPKTGLKVEESDPYLICNLQIKKYPKKACYDQMNFLVLSLTNSNLLSAAKFAANIQNDEFASEAMHGIAGAYGQNNVGKVNYDDVVKTCNNVQQRLQSDCMQGFLLGILEGGKPGEEYVEGQKFCSSNLLNDKEKISCFNDLVWNVSATNPKKLTDICNHLDQRYRQNCNGH